MFAHIRGSNSSLGKTPQRAGLPGTQTLNRAGQAVECPDTGAADHAARFLPSVSAPHHGYADYVGCRVCQTPRGSAPVPTDSTRRPGLAVPHGRVPTRTLPPVVRPVVRDFVFKPLHFAVAVDPWPLGSCVPVGRKSSEPPRCQFASHGAHETGLRSGTLPVGRLEARTPASGSRSVAEQRGVMLEPLSYPSPRFSRLTGPTVCPHSH